MSLSRSDLLTALQNEFSALATETSQVTTDTAAGYGPAIDYALRQTGTAQSELATGTIPTGDEDAGLLLAQYGALRRFSRALAGRVDITLDAPQVSKKRSQAFQQVQTLIAGVKAELEEVGYGESAFSMGSLQLDFLEPAEV